MSMQDKLLQVALFDQRMYTWLAFFFLSGCPPKKYALSSPLLPVLSEILTSRNPVVMASLIGDSMSRLGMSYVACDMKDMSHYESFANCLFVSFTHFHFRMLISFFLHYKNVQKMVFSIVILSPKYKDNSPLTTRLQAKLLVLK